MPSRLEVVHANNIIRLARAHLDLKQAMAACEVSGRVVAKEAAAARKAALADAKKRAVSKSGGKPKAVLADVKKRVASKPGGKPKGLLTPSIGVRPNCGPRSCMSLIYVHVVFHICALVVDVLVTDCMYV